MKEEIMEILNTEMTQNDMVMAIMKVKFKYDRRQVARDAYIEGYNKNSEYGKNFKTLLDYLKKYDALRNS